MSSRSAQAGFTLLETLVSLTLLLICVTALTEMIVGNSKIAKSEQLTATVQADARNCLTMVTERLRSAGWDPLNAGIPAVNLDPDPGDAVSEIEVLADLDEDGTTTGADEQILIRHVGTRVVWRRSADVSAPFEIVAGNITNDADGDGVPEPMFVPDSVTRPTRVTIRITAESQAPDPLTGRAVRYTVAGDVTLRKTL